MRTLPLLIALAACSSKSSAGQPPAEGEVAGVVLELDGAATAQSPGQARARALRPGAELLAGDVVATEESASLRARLYHNRAVLVLGGGKMLALRDSPAWKAAPAAGSLLEGSAGDGDTSVAGRHAENPSADTGATGKKPGTGGGAPPEPLAPQGTGQTPTVPEPPPPKPVPPPPDSQEPPSDWGIIGESGSLGKEDVQKGMLQIQPLMQECRAKAPPDTGEFGYRLRVYVRPDGTVRAVEVDESTGEPPPEVTRCVLRAMKKVSFPHSARGVTFTYPMQFKPEAP
ncbi:MAG TPA: hypothetical protein VL172_04575 [Kofleriaceae bacterium]|nr:hypothetical protein [Kofleriaceae bacterium]